MSKSRHFITFLNKMLHFDADIELVSILSDTYVSQCSALPTLFPQSDDATKYPTLSSQKVTTQSRTLAMKHLVNTVYSSYIKDLYEELGIYLKSIVQEAYEEIINKPVRFMPNKEYLQYHNDCVFIP